jgi:hypothetical protein
MKVKGEATKVTGYMFQVKGTRDKGKEKGDGYGLQVTDKGCGSWGQ